MDQENFSIPGIWCQMNIPFIEVLLNHMTKLLCSTLCYVSKQDYYRSAKLLRTEFIRLSSAFCVACDSQQKHMGIMRQGTQTTYIKCYHQVCPVHVRQSESSYVILFWNRSYALIVSWRECRPLTGDGSILHPVAGSGEAVRSTMPSRFNFIPVSSST